jgi:prepilin-type processing-associated H-X9-DG protein
VAYQPLDNHNGTGTNVLFGDNHVEWIDKQSWPSMTAAAGVAVVPSLSARQ